MFFTFRFDPLLGQSLASLAIPGLERDGVVTTQFRDRTCQHCFDAAASTDFACDFRRNLFIRRTAHVTQRFPNSILGKNV